MSSSSRVLRADELASVKPIWWLDRVSSAPESNPKKEEKPRVEPHQPAPPITDAERERIEREAYQRGFAEGKTVGKEQGAVEARPLIERLTKSLTELGTLRTRMRREGEKDLVKLSIAIARRVLHRELTLDPESIEGLIKVALEKLESRELSRVRVHPDQAAAIRALLERQSSARIEVIPDTTLNKGDVMFETTHGTLDASMDAQLREIERGLVDRLNG
jgi:flagellar assembly protein FliH